MNWLQRHVRPEQIRELSLLAPDHRRGPFFGSHDRQLLQRRAPSTASPRASPIIAVVAVGQTLVVLTRNIDLSVGSIVGFTAYFVGTADRRRQRHRRRSWRC